MYFRSLGFEQDGFTWFHWYGTMQFDYAWDVAFPSEADSGVEVFTFNGTDGYTKTTDINGWTDTMSFLADSTPEDASWYLFGGYPDYGGEELGIGGNLPLVGGEFWIDFGPFGVARVNTSQPSDFGKWAWDGSINPSWTAAKKGFAKGHNKQSLPSPK